MDINELRTDWCNGWFNEEDKMQGFLSEMTEKDEWKTIKLNDLTLSTFKETSENQGVTCSHDVMVEHSDKNGLVIGTHPVSELALPTLCERAMNNAKIMKRMTTQSIAKMLNMSWPYMTASQEAKMLIRGSRVLAVHTSNYTPLDQAQLLEITHDRLNELFDVCEFMGGSYTHEMTKALYHVDSLNNSGEGIVDSYKKAWTAAGYPPKSLDNATPAIMFTTSDNGRLCASIYPMFIQGRVEFTLGAPLKVKHTSQAELNNFNLNFDQCFALVKDGMAALEKLLTITVNHPVEALVRIAKTSRIPRDVATEAIELFKSQYTTGASVKAYEIYYAMMECLHSEILKSTKEETKLIVRESLARIPYLEWNVIDRSGSTTW